MPLDRIFERYRMVVCGSTSLMVATSWPLWVDLVDFPRVPFFPATAALPPWISWLLLGGILTSLTLATIGRAWRAMVGLSLVVILLSVLQDQDRLQPWVYQYLIIGIGLICCSKARALGLARWYTIALYVYSGLSKLDVSFCRELGPTFLSAGLSFLGISTARWPESLRTLAVLTMPGFEILVATLLSSRRTRRAGLVGSLLLHASLILILGPWSLGHSTIVLVWNAAQALENLCVFLPEEFPDELVPGSKFAPLAYFVFAIAIIMPLGERWGFCDAWPAHALYASHAERSDIFVHEDEIDRFPRSIRNRLGEPDLNSWRRLDLTGWSRDVRGTPFYPSGRIGNAVAEFLETHHGGERPIRLVQWGRARFWDGRRDREESLGLKSIRRRGDKFPINAHPTGRNP